MAELSPSKSKEKKQESTTLSKECTICGGRAIYSYFGAVACQPCKIFFRRNAERGREMLKCDFGGHCQINLDTRHICSYCRLMKCFASGMEIEKIRASRVTTTKRKLTRDLIRLNESEQTKFPTLNLLQADQSTLTVDQWNLISNISHCYNEHSGLSIGEHFMNEQNALPPKMRFKSAAVIELIQNLLDANQLIYKNNQDFLRLPVDDRSLLLHTTFGHAASLAVNFIIYKVRLMAHPSYYDIIETISHPNAIVACKRLEPRLDFDMIIFKLLLAIVCFSTTNYTIYSNIPLNNLSNIKAMLYIQDSYIELTWRYLLYKHGYEQTIKCFSDLIRCLFAIIDTITTATDIQWYTEKVDSLVQQTKQNLILDY